MKKIGLLILIFSLLVTIFSPLTLTFADNVALMIPGKIFTAEWIRQGVLPLWNPTLYGGIPWLADISQSVLYPSTLFFVLFKPAQALNITFLFHIIVSAMGMYVFSEYFFRKSKYSKKLSVLSALLWLTSAQFVVSLNNIPSLQSLTWLPWFVYFGSKLHQNKKCLFGVSAVVILQLLGGYPVHVLYSGITSAVFSAFFAFNTKESRTVQQGARWLAQWVIATVASLGLSAFVWMPFLDVLSHSTRTLQTDTQAVSGSLHPTEYIKLLIPYFFDNPKLGLRWGPGWNKFPNVSVYFPWIIGLLAVVAVWQKKVSGRVWLLTGLTVVPLVLALGEYLPGYSLLRNIPLFSLTRGPSLILVISAFASSLLIPELLSAVSFKKVSKKITAGVLALSGIVSVVLAAIYLYSRYSFITIWHLLNTFSGNAFQNSAFHTFSRDQLIMTSISENMLVSALSFVAVLFAVTKLRQNLKWLVVIAVLTLDVLYGSKAMLWFGPASIYNQENSLVSKLPQDAQSRYLIRNYNAPYTEYGSYWEAVYVRKPFSDSYVEPQELSEFKHLQRMVDGLTPNMHMSYGFNSLNAYTTLLPIDVDQRWNTTEVVGINNVPEISATNSALTDWAVQYYLVDTFYPTTEDFSPHELVLEKDLWKLYKRADALPRIRYEDGSAVEGSIVETPNSIHITPSNHATHSAIIIADRFDPNWRATVNGYPIPIENESGMRKIMVPNDAREILLSYRPRSVFTGGIISIVTLLVVGISSFLLSKKRDR